MKTTYVWCRDCEKVVPKCDDGCPECGGAPRNRFSPFAERRQRTYARGAAAAANLNMQAEHAVKHT